MQKQDTLSVYQLQAYMISFLSQKPFNLLSQIKDHGQKDPNEESIHSEWLPAVSPVFCYYDGCEVLKCDSGDNFPK